MKSYPFHGTLITTNPSQKIDSSYLKFFISISNVLGQELVFDYSWLLTNIINWKTSCHLKNL